jgi:predicted esterase
MKTAMRVQAAFFLSLVVLSGNGRAEDKAIAPIPRILPPASEIEVPEGIRAGLESRVASFADRIWEIDHKDHAADVGVLVKAVDFALEHQEFYSEKNFATATELLDLADQRHREIDAGESRSWLQEKGLIVRGYESKIDDSYQPYGLEVPESYDPGTPMPLLVWLHGRGDKTTDLHFLSQCRMKSQAFGGFMKDPKEAIVLYPFGRQCVGWKHAGEIDVFEAIESVMADYKIDPDRILLAGFSMGGAGAWHLGAHYPDHFCGVAPGAGFAETKNYLGLTPADYPPVYEQTLWKLYDVPEYARNFFNIPLLSYSGEKDKQRASAELMNKVLAEQGFALRQVIGLGMEHKYNQEAVDEIRVWLGECWKAGRGLPAKTIEWQTPTLRYPVYDWIRLTGLKKHWEDSRVHAEWDQENRRIQLELSGVTSFELNMGVGGDLAGVTVQIGDQTLEAGKADFPVNALSIIEKDGKWGWGEPAAGSKRPGVQGPIDDAFVSRFLVVGPEKAPAPAKFARWVDFERDHFRSRWKALMRGELREKPASEVNSEDIEDSNLLLWGDPDSNPLIAEIVDRLPIEWKGDSFQFRGETYSTSDHLPVFIFPNPLNPDRYVVINSGLTFREGHDKTNSLQNPKLPDWAVISMDQDPDAFATGRIVKAGFFSESWE